MARRGCARSLTNAIPNSIYADCGGVGAVGGALVGIS